MKSFIQRLRPVLTGPVLTGLLLSLMAAALFGAIAEDVATRDPVVRFDQAVETWLVVTVTPHLTGLSSNISLFGNAYVITALSALIIGWWAWKRNWSLAAGMLASVAGGGALNFLLKAVFQRPRPDLPTVTLHLADFSFPSGHAMISLIFYGFLAFVLIRNTRSISRRWLISLCAALIPLVVGLSRLVLGVHYPSDVLAGWLAGATWLTLCLTMVSARPTLLASRTP